MSNRYDSWFHAPPAETTECFAATGHLSTCRASICELMQAAAQDTNIAAKPECGRSGADVDGQASEGRSHLTDRLVLRMRLATRVYSWLPWSSKLRRTTQGGQLPRGSPTSAIREKAALTIASICQLWNTLPETTLAHLRSDVVCRKRCAQAASPNLRKHN